MSDVPHSIPPNATALSAEWLTESLRRSGTLTAAKVTEMSWTPVDKTGATATTDGLYGMRVNHRLEVKVDNFGLAK